MFPIATSSGTSSTGRRNSIGTKTSCVGAVKPAPISNLARNAIA